MKTLDINSLKEGKKQAIEYLKANTDLDDALINIRIELITDIDTTHTNKFVFILTKLSVVDNKKYNDLRPLAKALVNADKRGFRVDVDKYDSYDKLIKDLGMYTSKITRSDMKKGLSGLKEGRDYIKLDVDYEGIEVLIPLNHKASQVIASDKVGSCVGQWCTAQNNSNYWDDYVNKNGITLVYIINLKGATEKWGKYAMAIQPDEDLVEYFDERNRSLRLGEVELPDGLLNAIEEEAREIGRHIERDDGLPEWVKKADTHDMRFKIDDYMFIWKSGYWVHGTWEDGIWEGGTWEDGDWINGIWKDGIWKDGIWKDGTWKDGEWCSGTWHEGVWRNGTWEDGTWEGGTWLKGQWYDGVWNEGYWRDGIWWDGIWKDGIWRNGLWEDGEWLGGSIHDPDRKGNFEPEWVWDGPYVNSPINPKEYFSK